MAADAQAAGLPPLHGVSDRQRAYGETCRALVAQWIIDLFDDADARMPLDIKGKPPLEQNWWAQVDHARAVLLDTPPGFRRHVMDYLASQTSAGWWCDARERRIDDTIVDIARLHPSHPEYEGEHVEV